MKRHTIRREPDTTCWRTKSAFSFVFMWIKNMYAFVHLSLVMLMPSARENFNFWCHLLFFFKYRIQLIWQTSVMKVHFRSGLWGGYMSVLTRSSGTSCKCVYICTCLNIYVFIYAWVESIANWLFCTISWPVLKKMYIASQLMKSPTHYYTECQHQFPGCIVLIHFIWQAISTGFQLCST